LQPAERFIDGVARDLPVGGELPRRRQPGARRETPLDDRPEAGLVDLRGEPEPFVAASALQRQQRALRLPRNAVLRRAPLMAQ
jgi:hypothetical protein